MLDIAAPRFISYAMAIAIQAFTVVVRNEAIVHRYPGGAEAFMMNVPNQTFCADHSLARVSFTNDQEASAFMDELESLGMRVSDGHDAVLCDAFDQKVSPACPWLSLGTYKEATIAWVTGEPVKTIVGPRDWDPEKSGPKLPDDEATRNAKAERDHASLKTLFQQAGQVITSHLRNPGSPVDPAASVGIQRAIEQLEIVLDRAEETWRIHWLLGKAWHALGKSEKARAALTRAYALEKNEPVIPRELCGILLELGQSAKAVEVAEAAVGDDPLSPELLGNLAVAYLIHGQTAAAQKTMQAALKQQPENEINLTLMSIFTEIAEGRRKQPKNLFELVGEE